MFSKITFILSLVVFGFVAVNAAALGETCSSDSDCTVANSECKKPVTACTTGSCACKTGYGVSSGACLIEAKNTEACDDTKVCIGGTTCQSSVCACSGNTYHSLLQRCATTDKKAITEVCTVDTDCLDNGSGAECVVVDGSGSATKYCTCAAGYITESHACRKPRVDETCTAGVGCLKNTALTASLEGAGQEDETCESGTCTCPSTSDKLYVVFAGATHTFCQIKYTGTEKANGDTCTASNTCSSNVCYTCPGDSAGKCIDTSPSTENAATRIATVSGVAMVLMMAVVWLS